MASALCSCVGCFTHLTSKVWQERPVILLAIVAVMGLIELTVGREDYGSSEAEPGKLGEFWQVARPEDPQVREGSRWSVLRKSERHGPKTPNVTFVHVRQQAASTLVCLSLDASLQFHPVGRERMFNSLDQELGGLASLLIYLKAWYGADATV